VQYGQAIKVGVWQLCTCVLLLWLGWSQTLNQEWRGEVGWSEGTPPVLTFFHLFSLSLRFSEERCLSYSCFGQFCEIQNHDYLSGRPYNQYFFIYYEFLQHLLYTYFNRKRRLHVNPQQLEISTLIREKRKKNNYPPMPL
jgi:hypothetical protein